MSIEVKKLSFFYDKRGKDILCDVNASIEKGKVTGILGENGVGKSTLVKLISGITKFKEGTILLDEKNILEFSQSELARNVAYISQKEMPSHSLVYDMVLLGRKPYINWKITEEDKEIASNVISKLKIEHLMMKHCDEISGGEFQKVVLARALSQKPKYLLLDEPTSNLDPKNQHEILDILRNISVSENLGIVIAIHDLTLAMKYCHEFIVMKDKRILAQGGKEILTQKTIKEVYNINVDIINHNNVDIIVAL